MIGGSSRGKRGWTSRRKRKGKTPEAALLRTFLDEN